MLILKHQLPGPTIYLHTRRRRLNDSSAMLVPQSAPSSPPRQPCPQPQQENRQQCQSNSAHNPKVGFNDLPPEILLKILSYLPVMDTMQSSQTCRKLYSTANDYTLWQDLNLSGVYCPPPLRKLQVPAVLPPILEARLASCRSLYIDSRNSSLAEVSATILKQASKSPALTSVTLCGFPRKIVPTFLTFFRSCTAALTRIDLSRTLVPNQMITAILERHSTTLVSLEVEFSAITDYGLELVSQQATALKHLGLAGCLSLNHNVLKRFLIAGLPDSIESLDLRWLMDVELIWVEQMLLRREARRCLKVKSEERGGNGRSKAARGQQPIARIKRLDLRFCDLVLAQDVERLRRMFPEVEIYHIPKARGMYKLGLEGRYFDWIQSVSGGVMGNGGFM